MAFFYSSTSVFTVAFSIDKIITLLSIKIEKFVLANLEGLIVRLKHHLGNRTED